MSEPQIHKHTKQFNKKNIFLLGSREEYKILKTWSEQKTKNRYHLNGWFHDKEIPSSPQDLVKIYNSLTGKENVDHFILDPSDMNPEILQASIDWAESKGSRIHLIQSGTTYLKPKLNKKYRFGPFASVPLRREPLSSRFNQIRKRTFDLLLSSIVLFGIMWWFYPLMGLLIKLNSRGPVIIRQKRIGLNGKKYNCYKFRTMVSDKKAEEGYGEITKIDDNRITIVGSFLRITNLDELPQFLNVFLGNMSAIGPRPNPIKEDSDISDKVNKYRIRRFVKPGITGLAAIKGYRGGTDNLELMQKRINYDIEYIEKWSFWLDIKIAAITFWQMITFKTCAH